MTFTADDVVAEFDVEELRQLAEDLGMEPTLIAQVLAESGPEHEVELLAAFVAQVFNDLQEREVPVADWIRAVAERRAIGDPRRALP